MGGDTGRGADVYLETHGESVFKRLCHIMILVKEDETVDTLLHSPEDCRWLRDLEIQFQTNDGRAVRAWEVDLAVPWQDPNSPGLKRDPTTLELALLWSGSLIDESLLRCEEKYKPPRRPPDKHLAPFQDPLPAVWSSWCGVVWCQPSVLLRGHLTSFPTSIATFEVYPWHRPLLRRDSLRANRVCS